MAASTPTRAQRSEKDKLSFVATGKETTCEDVEDEHSPQRVRFTFKQAAPPFSQPQNSNGTTKQEKPAPIDPAVLIEAAKCTYSSICVLKAKMDVNIAEEWKDPRPSNTMRWLLEKKGDEVADKHRHLVEQFKGIASTLQKHGFGEQVPKVEASIMEDLEFYKLELCFTRMGMKMGPYECQFFNFVKNMS